MTSQPARTPRPIRSEREAQRLWRVQGSRPQAQPVHTPRCHSLPVVVRFK